MACVAAVMSGFKDIHMEQQGQCDDMECWYAHEEQACHNAISEIASFINSGAISFEEVERIIRGKQDV